MTGRHRKPVENELFWFVFATCTASTTIFITLICGAVMLRKGFIG